MEVTTKSEKETKQLAQKISTYLRAGDVLALSGDMGTGKTTFTKYLVSALGFDSKVQSPTFILLRQYQKQNDTNTQSTEIRHINHIDLYRLATPEEIENLDLNEIMEMNNSITIVEWPELLMENLPEKTIHIRFKSTQKHGERIINVQNLHRHNG